MRAAFPVLTVVLAFVASLTPATPARSQAASVAIVIIVNAENTVKRDDYGADEIRKIFLKNLTTWPDNTKILPFQLASGTEEAELFRKEILGKESKELSKYWSAKKADDGTSEPDSKKTSAELFKLVIKNVSAIGYINESYYDGLTQDERNKVKVLRTIRKS